MVAHKPSLHCIAVMFYEQPRSVNFRQHFRNLSRKTVPLKQGQICSDLTFLISFLNKTGKKITVQLQTDIVVIILAMHLLSFSTLNLFTPASLPFPKD
jgi:hypothetical protein